MKVIEIRIQPKKGVADPEGKNIKKTLESMGFEIGEVKTSKVYEIEIEGTETEARIEGVEMSKKLLANPVIENFQITVR
ncbi:MAG TPA: phosphoribosylformylglycinamidine synthase subunit PurS [Candidatus Methanomethylophilaceae archaeon]|nr:phosphoribosylformylglycinamidine synthase subunit PurS [Candidatus Methanomethylophilaceae archaeon]